MWFKIVRKTGFVTRASVRSRGFRVVYVWSASLALVLCVREMKSLCRACRVFCIGVVSRERHCGTLNRSRKSVRYTPSLVPGCAIILKYDIFRCYDKKRPDANTQVTTLTTTLNKTSDELLQYGDTPIKASAQCKSTPPSHSPHKAVPLRASSAGAAAAIGVWGSARPLPLSLPSLPPPLVGALPHPLPYVERHGTCQLGGVPLSLLACRTSPPTSVQMAATHKLRA